MFRHFATMHELVIHDLKRWKYRVFKVQKACKKAICRLWVASVMADQSVTADRFYVQKQVNIFSVLYKHQ